MNTTFWMFAIAAVGIYCASQAVRDYRRGDYAMAAIGVACAGLLLLTPIQTHAVKLDFPPPIAQKPPDASLTSRRSGRYMRSRVHWQTDIG